MIRKKKVRKQQKNLFSNLSWIKYANKRAKIDLFMSGSKVDFAIKFIWSKKGNALIVSHMNDIYDNYINPSLTHFHHVHRNKSYIFLTMKSE